MTHFYYYHLTCVKVNSKSVNETHRTLHFFSSYSIKIYDRNQWKNYHFYFLICKLNCIASSHWNRKLCSETNTFHPGWTVYLFENWWRFFFIFFFSVSIAHIKCLQTKLKNYENWHKEKCIFLCIRIGVKMVSSLVQNVPSESFSFHFSSFNSHFFSQLVLFIRKKDDLNINSEKKKLFYLHCTIHCRK